MKRDQVFEMVQNHLLPTMTDLYDLNDYKIKVVEAHEGGRNLVYRCENEEKGDKIIRISFLADRTTHDYLSELEFVRYLHEHGGSVANVLDSKNGRKLEEIIHMGQRLFVSVFDKAEGDRLVDHGYQYREGAPLSEYHYNCGKTLGKLHAIAKEYEPVHERYSFFDKYNAAYIDEMIPDTLPLLKEKLKELIKSLEQLDRGTEVFGMVHFDYSDGNYMIDYGTGDITVFDFDNTCRCWYMYDLANVWTHGVGWIQFEPDATKRQLFMKEYFETVLQGYLSETAMDQHMLEKLPLFIKAGTMESILDAFEVARNNGEKIDCDEELSYLMTCIEEDIPYLGFFEESFSCEEPFIGEGRDI